MQVEQKQFDQSLTILDALYISVNNCKMPWEVMDISKGGLSFQYSPAPGAEIESGLISILSSDYNDRDVTNIPCSLIYDHLVVSESRMLNSKEIRRRGLEFIELSEIQTESLDLLLDKEQRMIVH